MRLQSVLILTAAILLLPTCRKKEAPEPEPERVAVQHILVAFAGTIDSENVRRSRDEAEALVKQIMAEIAGGADFDSLVRRFTDDQYPGIYRMSNLNVEPQPGEYPRSNMVKGFGDLSFRLQQGEVGVCEYEPTLRYSPFGWHIIKRLD